MAKFFWQQTKCDNSQTCMLFVHIMLMSIINVNVWCYKCFYVNFTNVAIVLNKRTVQAQAHKIGKEFQLVDFTRHLAWWFAGSAQRMSKIIIYDVHSNAFVFSFRDLDPADHHTWCHDGLCSPCHFLLQQRWLISYCSCLFIRLLAYQGLHICLGKWPALES